jgi:N-acyl-D-amino-acid deacylase
LFDLLLRGGTVIDGTGAARVSADVGIRGDRIAAVGRLPDVAANRTIDCRDRVVAPGLIDVHNHSDGWMLLEPHQYWKTSQGFTTEVLAADGIGYAPVSERTWRQWLYYLKSLDALPLAAYTGWKSLADYMRLLEGRSVQNAATHVPYANVRTLVCGFGRKTPDDFQMRLIRDEIRRGMEEGAVGLSTGLDYLSQCNATTEEIANACTAVVPFGGLYVTHVRYKLGLLPALREAVEIGKRSGVKVHISHLKGGDEREVQEVLAFLDQARRDVDLSFDVYPYQRGSTMLNFLLPYEAWDDGPLGVLAHLDRPEIRARFAAGLESWGVPLEQIHIAWTDCRSRLPGGTSFGETTSTAQSGSARQAEPTGSEPTLIGKSVPEFASERGKPAHEALVDLLIETNLATLMVVGPPDREHLVEPIIQHDLAILGSDGIYFPGGVVHPRVFGSGGRWLGPLVRNRKVFSLEEAVHKASGKAAERFGLADRGVIREGAFADLIVFDQGRVADLASYDQPQQLCAGFDHVFVNGREIPSRGEQHRRELGDLPGRYLRRS